MLGVRKNFFLVYDFTICGMPQISLISTDIFTKNEKSTILFHFCFYYLKGGNLEAASLAYIRDFIDKNG